MMGCRITDHAKEDPEWGMNNADLLCPGECHTMYGPCPHWYDDKAVRLCRNK